MPLSRTHIAFLGIISMITGMIAPGVGANNQLLSYLMTDVRGVSYVILFFLIIGFALSALRAWRWYRLVVVTILLGLGYLVFMTMFSHVHAIRDGSLVGGFQWGWIFFSIGAILLVTSYRKPLGEKEDFSETIDALIGIVGGFALACIVGMLILSSLSFFGTSRQAPILEELFGSGKTQVFSGGVMSMRTYGTLPNINYNRKSDVLVVTSLSGGKMNQEIFGSGETATGKIKTQNEFFMSGKTVLSGNKLHAVSGEVKNGIMRLSYDKQNLGRDLEEVREVFVSDDGSYSYFARPLGEKKFCFFTRYRGSICGLEGYMNPTLGADGSSVLFAGYKDGLWSLYRNTLRIVKNTGYTKTEGIASDYIFFDITHPETYLFIEKDIKSGNYQYRKNGILLPKRWEDVSTEVYFGYDNHILTTAKDQGLWRVIEL